MKPTLPIMMMAASVVFFLLAFSADKDSSSDFEEAREVIVMRKIAHQILLYTGDSSSRVLPVKQISSTEYQIPFESSFSFTPDSLVSIIDRLIADNDLSSGYIVNMKACGSDELIYGYAFLGSSGESIVPCGGRKQPDLRYCLSIRFHEKTSYNVQTMYISGIGLIGAGLLLFGIQRYRRRRHPLAIGTTGSDDRVSQSKEENGEKNNTIAIGKFIFDATDQLLKINDEKIVLTQKEAKLLTIFASTPNHTIDRSRLQKEVWEDEGVIVGRSLDMFISKLRKKLEADPQVKLINIHGKGYKLEISQIA